MEAARTLIDLPERMRRHRFTTACEELRPLGIAYVLRNFGRSLDRADAEDVVAEVIIRLDRLDSAGRPPDRLRPAFFTSVRNAAVDQLRYRGVRPTAPLEAAAAHTSDSPGPEEHAESHDDLARLREAMARMRPNYREAIVLRFGLGLSVPQISERLGVSLPAAKKLVLRSTAQIRERMEAIDGREFCPEMRALAERSVLDAEVVGIAEGAAGAAIKAHLEHCGACRGFLAGLRGDLHELGGAALLGGLASGRLGLTARVLSGLHGISHGAQAGVGRIRLATYRAGGALTPDSPGSAGVLAGTGQKLAAICTAGAASAATCLATGIVGPGIGVGASHHVDPNPTPPPAHVRVARAPVQRPSVSYSAPPDEPRQSTAAPTRPVVPVPRGAAKSAHPEPKPAAAEPQAERKRVTPATPAQTEQSEFGFEGEEAPSPAPAQAEAPATESRTFEETAPTTNSTSGSSKSTSGSASSAGGQEEFGFGG
jgi:RNA polymerase sigma factor (sigma-70 family)